MAGATNAQPAVIDTSPAMAPLSAKVGSGFRNQIQAVNSAPTAPAAAATLVLSAIRAMLRSVPATVLPALKPNHPNQRMKTPSDASGRLWPGMARAVRPEPFCTYLPTRGPMTMAPTRPSQPPVEWTTVEPAKSAKPGPMSFSQPPPQVQWPTIG